MVNTNTPPPRLPYPAVSVVIPMYNVEKYIGDCLDSLLAQTFQDFEVILVNDCSTDNSRQIAESYLDKFGGRLKIYDNEKNSGPGATRNRGLIFSRGKYIFFMDGDDLLLLTGLEEMYALAKKYDADFLNCTCNYNMSEDAKELTFMHWLRKVVPKIIVEKNLQWRVEKLFLKNAMTWTLWRRLLKRDFLLENNLFFAENVRIYEDQIWTIRSLFCANTVVHVPKAFYFYRLSASSLMRTKKNELQKINNWLRIIVLSIKSIDNTISKLDFFKQNPQLRYAVLEHYAQWRFDKILKLSPRLQQFDIYNSIRQEFGENFGEYDVLIPILCSVINKYQKIILSNNKRIAELEEQLKAK